MLFKFCCELDRLLSALNFALIFSQYLAISFVVRFNPANVHNFFDLICANDVNVTLHKFTRLMS